MKLAPQGQATAYLAGAGLATSVGAGLGPMLGGRFADYFSVRQLSLTFEWIDPNRFLEIGALNLTGFDFLFGITFLLGLITLGLLGGVREEGEAGREVVLESLFAPIQSMSRPISSVAGLGFLSQFPYGRLGRVPGLDVALGVTAYQIAETARVATKATARGKRVTAKMGRALEDGIRVLVGGRAEAHTHADQVARQAARGAIHGLGDVAMLDVSHISKQAALGVSRALRLSRHEAKGVLRGVGYGIIEGTEEVQADVADAIAQAIYGARTVAPELGLSTEEAVKEVVQGVLEAGDALGPLASEHIKEALAEELLEGPDTTEERWDEGI
jgi:hypothetical protein